MWLTFWVFAQGSQAAVAVLPGPRGTRVRAMWFPAGDGCRTLAGHSRLPEATAAPCLPHGHLLRGATPSAKTESCVMSHNHDSDILSPLLYLIDRLEASHGPCTHSRRGWHSGVNPEAEDTGVT